MGRPHRRRETRCQRASFGRRIVVRGAGRGRVPLGTKRPHQRRILRGKACGRGPLARGRAWGRVECLAAASGRRWVDYPASRSTPALDGFPRNRWLAWIGIIGRLPPECASLGLGLAGRTTRKHLRTAGCCSPVLRLKPRLSAPTPYYQSSAEKSAARWTGPRFHTRHRRPRVPCR